MSEQRTRDADSAGSRLAVKLRAFFDDLPDDEKVIMARIMRAASQPAEVEGYGRSEPITAEEVSPPRSPIDEFRVNLGLYLDKIAWPHESGEGGT